MKKYINKLLMEYKDQVIFFNTREKSLQDENEIKFRIKK
jgi:hypothetical protein